MNHIKIILNTLSKVYYIVSLFFLDYLSKYFIHKKVYMFTEILIFPGIKITHIINHGFSFGLFENQYYIFKCFLIISILIIFYFIYNIFYINRYSSLYENIAYLMIISGSLGNVCDRLIYGHVIDFILLNIGRDILVFNFADIYIFLGVLWILL